MKEKYFSFQQEPPLFTENNMWYLFLVIVVFFCETGWQPSIACLRFSKPCFKHTTTKNIVRSRLMREASRMKQQSKGTKSQHTLKYATPSDSKKVVEGQCFAPAFTHNISQQTTILVFLRSRCQLSTQGFSYRCLTLRSRLCGVRCLYRLTGWLLEWSWDGARVPTSCFFGLRFLSCLLWPLCRGSLFLLLLLFILILFIASVTISNRGSFCG